MSQVPTTDASDAKVPTTDATDAKVPTDASDAKVPTAKVLANKCVHVRAEIEGRAYRIISFFHQHPSEVSEDAWSIFRHDKGTYVVDKLTLSVMAECECELLTRASDIASEEPAIVSVSLKEK